MILGVDVSTYQGAVDWARVRGAGISFAFCKATEGIAIRDSTFVRNATQARAEGILVGAYHYFRPLQDPKRQAATFVSACEGISLDLPPVLDFETKSNGGAQSAKGARECIEEIERITGRLAIVYSYVSFLQELPECGDRIDLARRPLWIAHYNGHPGAPIVPKPWATWTFHQYSCTAVIDGIANPCDADAFYGSDDDLRALVNGPPLVAPIADRLDGLIDPGSNPDDVT